MDAAEYDLMTTMVKTGESFCRCCLSGGDMDLVTMTSMTLVSIDSGGRILDAFWACSGLNATSFIDGVDANPKICRLCLSSLETAVVFQQLCKRANEMLHDQHLPAVVEVASPPQEALVGIERLPHPPKPDTLVVIDSESETDDATSVEEVPSQEKKKKCFCQLCMKKRPVVEQKSIEAQIKCEFTGCLKKFANQKAYESHIQVHDNFLLRELTNVEPWQCDNCTTSFKTKRQLNSHQKYKHRLFNCKVENCGQTFPTYYKMRLHLQASHSKTGGR